MSDNFSEKKEHDTFYITHKIELLIWLIVICVIVVFSTFSNLSREQKLQDYNIFMPDIDGLIVGSPVRMMGIEVGHIIDIKPTNDEVAVRFIITNKDITIPQGTQATTEFNGMAGSKSLELYLPEKNTYIDDSTPILTVTPPKRLHEAAGLLNEMFKKLGSVIKTASYFGSQLQEIDLPKGNTNTQSIEDFLKYANETLDTSIERAENLEKKINERK